MKGFDGFRAGRQAVVPIPDAFFAILLPQIDNVCELKVTLHLFWLLARREGLPKVVAWSELRGDPALLRTVKTVKGPRPAEDYLREGLDLALARGTLLMIVVERVGGGEDYWYLLNTASSRAALDRLQRAEVTVAETLRVPWTDLELVRIHRPNIFALYEQNIGALTPILADELRDAELSYPEEWITSAIKLAVETNRRSWRYIQGILRRWEAEGKGSGADWADPQASDRERFTSGRYGHLVET